MEEIFPLLVFLKDYSLSTVIIALVISVVDILCNHYLKGKVPMVILSLIPFVVSVIFAITVDMLFYAKAFVLRTDAIYSGVLSGALAVIIRTVIFRLKTGKNISGNPLELVIDGILEGYIKADYKAIAVSSIVGLVSDLDKIQQENLPTEIVKVIKQYSLDGFDEKELLAVSHLIMQAVNSLNKK